MADRFEEAKIRDEIVASVRKDLVGPETEDEILTESPMFAYLTGMLYPKNGSFDYDTSEQEVGFDMDVEGGADYSQDDDEDDGQTLVTSKFKQQSSLGLSFYMKKSAKAFTVNVKWGEYSELDEVEAETEDLLEYAEQNDSGKKKTFRRYKRYQEHESFDVEFDKLPENNEYLLKIDSRIKVKVTVFQLVNDYQVISVFLSNERAADKDNPTESIMFQASLSVASKNGDCFIAENICRDSLASDEYLFSQRPIFGRGRGCAVSWDALNEIECEKIETSFIPEYELAGVSASFSEFEANYFSTYFMGKVSNKNETINRLNGLTRHYENWINNLAANPKMKDPDYYEHTGKNVVDKCREALRRMNEGIEVLNKNDIAFEAFAFMNKVMKLQKNINDYSKKRGKGIACDFREFVDVKNPDNNMNWYPFQIAFILMNIVSIVYPESDDRNIVDLLYFPTGGGKTEAYLGLIAFTIANRRLSRKPSDKFNKDGGVTAFLRYTLRLLTTQQRDRITRMIVAADKLRSESPDKYGHERISIGFWVGSDVTPNSFSELCHEDLQARRTARRKLENQLLTCPFCGTQLNLDPNNKEAFRYDEAKNETSIFCPNDECIYAMHPIYGNDRTPIPVYLTDEEIYRKCPTVVLATVDKFARLPWDPKTNALFGRVDKRCGRHGYISLGEYHEYTHREDVERRIPKSTTISVKMFAPPELIVQDELHLITGPLGTIYGGYETLIEDLCSYEMNGKIIKPKYVCSTATIKNAEEQIKCLYGREKSSVFPSRGLFIGDSFFIRDEPVESKPFRKYVGICANGQSMKTTLLRTFAIVLESAYELSKKPEIGSLIDPYYTLVGYFNSIRELGGAVRLIQDDIPKRMNRISRRYGYDNTRFLNREEITSRINSRDIAKKLQKLETTFGNKGCVDTVVATNMIAVGMDVDRLGLMAVMGQPKLNSEYIQATSRIGRKHPGLVFTIYNPYRPRDLSHYENFTGYHMQLYRYVEGTTATPFAARARDRFIHAIVIAALRMKYPEMNSKANHIINLTDQQIADITKVIEERIALINPQGKEEAMREIRQFVDSWKKIASKKKVVYSGKPDADKEVLMVGYEDRNMYGKSRSTLNSMREVESGAVLYYEEGK